MWTFLFHPFLSRPLHCNNIKWVKTPKEFENSFISLISPTVYNNPLSTERGRISNHWLFVSVCTENTLRTKSRVSKYFFTICSVTGPSGNSEFCFPSTLNVSGESGSSPWGRLSNFSLFPCSSRLHRFNHQLARSKYGRIISTADLSILY